jgi:hypothetical protein
MGCSGGPGRCWSPSRRTERSAPRPVGRLWSTVVVADQWLPLGAEVKRGVPGQVDLVAAVGAHRVDLQVPVAVAGEDDPAAVGRPGGVWALDVAELVELARRRLTRTLNDEECRQYLHLAACPPGD